MVLQLLACCLIKALNFPLELQLERYEFVYLPPWTSVRTSDPRPHRVALVLSVLAPIVLVLVGLVGLVVLGIILSPL